MTTHPCRPPRRTTKRISRDRRGALYVLVLVTALVVSAIGFTALTVSRVRTLSGRRQNEAATAALLATSAVDYALVTLNADSQWRTTYTHNVEYENLKAVGGTCCWKVRDTVDTDLADDPQEPARLYGIGRAGGAVRVYSVLLPTEIAIDALRTPVHCQAAIAVNNTPSAVGGPWSTNAALSVVGAGYLYGNVEANTVSNPTGTIDGIVVAPAPAKPLPTRAVFDVYAADATTIPYGAISGGEIRYQLLSSTLNPYGAANAQGRYLIQVPANATLKIWTSRFEATLLVSLATNSELEITGAMVWEPPAPDVATLVVDTQAGARVKFRVDEGNLSELTALTNYNPPSFPYQGASDILILDSFPSVLTGVFHVAGANAQTTLEKITPLRGSLLSECPLDVFNSPVATADPNLLLNKPLGFTEPAVLTPLAGSWIWDEP